jgi:genome maintenance exonuclease 1
MITKKFNYIEFGRTTEDGKRLYLAPDGSKLPSVTTILDATKTEEQKKSLQEWRNRVGHERATQITTEAANRGTRMHTYLERHIKNGEIGAVPSNPFAQPSWLMAHAVVEAAFHKVDEFWGTEVPLYYSGLYAGTTDCVGQWQGKPAILDFKQSNKVKKREWIDDYFMQLSAYALAHDKMYNTNIDHAVILMCVKPVNDESVPEYLEFEVGGNEFEMWKGRWLDRVSEYYSKIHK